MARTGAAAIMRSRLIVLALLLLGAGLRLAALGDVPPGLYHDEAFNGLDALRVIEEGDFPLYFPANNGREPLFIYLIAASVSVLGRSPLAVRLPSFFVGFLTLAATYDLARVLFNRRVGRWTLAVLAVTFWHVHLSRMGFRAVLLPLFTADPAIAPAIEQELAADYLSAGVFSGSFTQQNVCGEVVRSALMIGTCQKIVDGAEIRLAGFDFCDGSACGAGT